MLRLINFAHSEIFMLGMFGQYAVLMLLGFAPSGNVYNEGTVMTIIYLGIAMLGGMAVSGGAAVGLERLAYRPLRKRNAPRSSCRNLCTTSCRPLPAVSSVG